MDLLEPLDPKEHKAFKDSAEFKDLKEFLDPPDHLDLEELLVPLVFQDLWDLKE